MNQDFSFRMMQGKGGRSGHIKKEGQQLSLSFRHLPPSIPCTLYRDGRVMDTQSSSPQGTLQFTCRQDGFFFLCHENNLLLWETGEDSSRNYFRAQKMLPRPEKITNTPSKAPLPAPTNKKEEPLPQDAASDASAVRNTQPTSAQTTAHSLPESAPALESLPENAAGQSAPPPVWDNTSVSHPIPPEKKAEDAPRAPFSATVQNPALKLQPSSLPPPDLNPRSAAPSVMTLPPLQWPPALAHLQAVFTNGTPYRPFRQPEFRCVKVPAKNPALPYGIMGYQLKDDRVCALLQAVPGHPLIPPRGFEGTPYRDGHFIRIQPLPPAKNSP